WRCWVCARPRCGCRCAACEGRTGTLLRPRSKITVWQGKASMSERIRVAVCGAAGRMGSRIAELAADDPAFALVGAIESKQHPSSGKKILDGKIAITGDLLALK